MLIDLCYYIAVRVGCLNREADLKKYLQLGISCLLFVLYGARITPASAQQLTAAERTAWTQRLTNLIPNSLEGTRTVQDLAALPSDDIFTVLQDNWKQLSNPDIKMYVLSCIVQNDNARVLDILNMGVTDPSIPVQNRALQFAESFGFDSFTEDYDAYLSWREKTVGKPLQEVIELSMKSVAAALPHADDNHRSALFNILVRTNFNATSRTSRIRREAAIAAGLPDALVPWLNQQNNLMWTAYQILRNIRPTEPFMRKVILPLTDLKTETVVRYQALAAMGFPENIWAVPALTKMLLAEYPDPSAEMLGQTLAQIGDPHAIPVFLSIMANDNTPEGNRVIGNILSPLAGVSNAYVRDIKWWQTWWMHNEKRFPEDLRGKQLPKVSVRARPLVLPPGGQAAGATPTLHQIAADPKRAYWFIDPRTNGERAELGHPPLIGINGNRTVLVNSIIRFNAEQQPPAPPVATRGVAANASTMGLLVVLTSDGDAASAAGFWQDAALNALGRKYFVAVVAAPKWIDNQPVVWVTEQDLKTVKTAKFATETLVNDVVNDVTGMTGVSVDRARIYLHGVGAAGSAVFSASLAENSPFKGFWVLSSTFKSAGLPPLERSSGRHYYIQNAKDDHAHPQWMAEAAQKLLMQKGATVKLDPTAGYLGVQSSSTVTDQIRGAISWLATGK